LVFLSGYSPQGAFMSITTRKKGGNKNIINTEYAEGYIYIYIYALLSGNITDVNVAHLVTENMHIDVA
jgi:hypothetical protein